MTESDYFNYSFVIKNNKPKFKLSLKKEFLKKDKPFFTSANGKKMPISSSSEKYFKYYFLDNNLAKSLYDFRKKFFDINHCIFFWRENIGLSQKDLDICNEFILASKNKERKNYLSAVEKDSYKDNLSMSRAKSAEKISITLKEKFKDPEYKRMMIEKLHSKESTEKRIKSFLKTMANDDVKGRFLAAINDPIRISRSSEKKRENWKKLSPEKKESQLKNLRYKKNYNLNNFKMNLNEFIVGSILTELSEDWSYESEVKFGEKSYYPDFKIESKKIIIECYGTFWHADPRLFEESSIVMGSVLANDIWKRDDIRINNLRSLGYQVFIIWEQEIHKSRDDLRGIIKDAIGA